MGAFLVICLWDTAAHAAADGWAALVDLLAADNAGSSPSQTQTLLRLLLTDYSVSETDLVVFLVFLLFARFIALFLQENNELGSKLLKLGWKTLFWDYLWRAFRLWWPLPAVFVVFGMWLYPMLTDWFATEVAKQIQNELVESEYKEAAKEEPRLEAMVDHLIEFNRREMIRQGDEAVNKIAWSTIKSAEQMRTVVYPTLENEVFPPRLPGTRTDRCRRRSLSCHAKNGVKSVANSGYRRLRDPPLNVTKRKIDAAYYAAKGNVDQFKPRAEKLIKEEANAFANHSRVAFEKALYAGRMFSLIMLLYGIMVLLKTYGMVVARIIFDTDNRRRFHARVSNEDTDPDYSAPIASRVRHITQQPMPLLKEDGVNYYLARDVALPAGLPMAYVPYPLKAIGRRLWPPRYLMSYVDVAGGKYEEVCVQLPALLELVRWDIAEGEEVVFQYKDLVGFSEGVRLNTHITFSLQALVFGRVVFHTAVGKGKLLLRTPPNPVVGMGEYAEEGPRQARDTGSLISWQTRTPFEVHSDLSIKGVYLRGYNLEKQAKGRVVYAYNPSSPNSALITMAHWIRTFLSPI